MNHGPQSRGFRYQSGTRAFGSVRNGRDFGNDIVEVIEDRVKLSVRAVHSPFIRIGGKVVGIQEPGIGRFGKFNITSSNIRVKHTESIQVTALE